VQVRLFAYPSFSSIFCLITSVFLTRLFSLLRMFPHSLLLQRNDPTPQARSLFLRFCGYHRRTEIHATTSCACFIGPHHDDHDLFGGCVGSTPNNVSILPHLLNAHSKSRSTVHIRSDCIIFYHLNPSVHISFSVPFCSPLAFLIAFSNNVRQPLLAYSCFRQPFVLVARWRPAVVSCTHVDPRYRIRRWILLPTSVVGINT
jgi:hypothetical protein